MEKYDSTIGSQNLDGFCFFENLITYPAIIVS